MSSCTTSPGSQKSSKCSEAIGIRNEKSVFPRPKGRRLSANSKLRCTVCNQNYSRKDNLRVHQRVHSGERPFKCRYCGQLFRWMGAFRIHENNHVRDGHSIGESRDVSSKRGAVSLSGSRSSSPFSKDNLSKSDRSSTVSSTSVSWAYKGNIGRNSSSGSGNCSREERDRTDRPDQGLVEFGDFAMYQDHISLPPSLSEGSKRNSHVEEVMYEPWLCGDEGEFWGHVVCYGTSV